MSPFSSIIIVNTYRAKCPLDWILEILCWVPTPASFTGKEKEGHDEHQESHDPSLRMLCFHYRAYSPKITGWMNAKKNLHLISSLAVKFRYFWIFQRVSFLNFRPVWSSLITYCAIIVAFMALNWMTDSDLSPTRKLYLSFDYTYYDLTNVFWVSRLYRYKSFKKPIGSIILLRNSVH